MMGSFIICPINTDSNIQFVTIFGHIGLTRCQIVRYTSVDIAHVICHGCHIIITIINLGNGCAVALQFNVIRGNSQLVNRTLTFKLGIRSQLVVVIFPQAITYHIMNNLSACVFICLPVGTFTFTIYTGNQGIIRTFGNLTIFIHLQNITDCLARSRQGTSVIQLQIRNGNAVIGLKGHIITIFRGIGNCTAPVIGLLYISKHDFINLTLIDDTLGIRTAEICLRNVIPGLILFRNHSISGIDDRKLVITRCRSPFHNCSFIDNILGQSFVIRCVIIHILGFAIVVACDLILADNLDLGIRIVTQEMM